MLQVKVTQYTNYVVLWKMHKIHYIAHGSTHHTKQMALILPPSLLETRNFCSYQHELQMQSEHTHPHPVVLAGAQRS